MAAPEHLFCWEGDFGLPSVSTDCLTVMAYAQFAGAPLKIHKMNNPWRSPSGSLPALRTNQNETLTRPSDIIIHLRKQKYNADFDLSAKEGADSLAFISLIQEKLLPALIYFSWVDSKNFADVTRRWFSEHLPFPLGLILPGRMHRLQNERLRLLRGGELLEPEENLEKEMLLDALDCMNLLSQRLGRHKFFFGDSPSSLDAVVFGHLAPVFKIKFPNSKLQQHLQTLENLCVFCSTVLQLYFPPTGTDPAPRPPPVAPDDGDHVPHKRRKQLLSMLFAVGAMLSYAVLTGILSVSLHQTGALEEPPDDEPETHEQEHQP
ncbi:metaxin-1-like [Eucyclogobius newberryi]|uniref:metaxin-1-like n=1 Tax=Eucyclogobius newberryi TaxID=166745 RepID=UPI003B5CD7F0